MQVHGHPARHFPLNYISGTFLVIIILLSGLLGVAILSVTDNLPNVFDDDDAVSVIAPAPSIAHPADRGAVRQGADTGAVTLDGNLNAFTEAREGDRIAPAPKAYFGVGMGEGLIAGGADLASPIRQRASFDVNAALGNVGAWAVPASEPVDLGRMRMLEENLYLPGIAPEKRFDLNAARFKDQNTYLPGWDQDATNGTSQRPGQGLTDH